jgi:hypothetical protein|tara:strand:+ start:723 stop:1031 length:309 start_codon:yes stop_codon:yes gene_type:complete
MVKDIYHPAEIREDIEKKFYSAKIGKIVTLAKNGKYDEALEAIARLDSVGADPYYIQKVLYEETASLAVMDDVVLPENPYEYPRPKKRSAPRRKKKRHKGKR